MISKFTCQLIELSLKRFVLLSSISFSVYDKLPDPHCDCGTSSPREDLHFKKAHSVLKLDRRAD